MPLVLGSNAPSLPRFPLKFTIHCLIGFGYGLALSTVWKVPRPTAYRRARAGEIDPAAGTDTGTGEVQVSGPRISVISGQSQSDK